jgi:hypothetical protein
MDKAELQNKINTLKRFNHLKKDNKFEFVKICPEEYIHTICEGCYNILHDSFKLSAKKKYAIKKKLGTVRFDIRKLSDPKVAVKAKREILSNQQVGGGIFTILATTVLPALISALVSK